MKPINFEQTGIYKKGVSLVDKETLDNIAYEAQKALLEYLSLYDTGMNMWYERYHQVLQHFGLDKE